MNTAQQLQQWGHTSITDEVVDGLAARRLKLQGHKVKMPGEREQGGAEEGECPYGRGDVCQCCLERIRLEQVWLGFFFLGQPEEQKLGAERVRLHSSAE